MKKKAFIYIILAGLLWGTSGIFVHFLAPLGFSSLQMTAMRALVSALTMSGYVLFHDKSLFKVSIKELMMFALSGISIFATAALYYISMQASSVSTAVMLMYTAPIFILIYSVAFLGERLTKLKVFVVLLMILGCALVSGIIGGIKFSTWGIVTGFLSGISYSIYNILTKIEMRNKCNPVSATLYNFTFMALVALLSCNLPQMASVMVDNATAGIPLMLGIGICTCILPYFLYTLALRDLPAGVASALGIVEPMAATVYSVVLFREQLGLLSGIGIVMILFSVFLLGKSEE